MDLKELNSLGFLAGPGESESDFSSRIEQISSEHLYERVFPSKTLALSSISSDLYNIKVSWFKAFQSKSYSIFTAANTHIYSKGKLVFPVLKQSRFCTSSKAKRNNLLLHETIHAVRAAFNESNYEEFIAYSCSSSILYRTFGPVFKNSYESLAFSTLSLIPLLASFFIDSHFALSFLPLATFSTFLIIRLLCRRITFQRCLVNLRTLFSSGSDPLAITLRLTDLEIDLFSKSSHLKAMQYIKSRSCLRWRQILASYPLLSK